MNRAFAFMEGRRKRPRTLRSLFPYAKEVSKQYYIFMSFVHAASSSSEQ